MAPVLLLLFWPQPFALCEGERRSSRGRREAFVKSRLTRLDMWDTAAASWPWERWSSAARGASAGFNLSLLNASCSRRHLIGAGCRLRSPVKRAREAQRGVGTSAAHCVQTRCDSWSKPLSWFYLLTCLRREENIQYFTKSKKTVPPPPKKSSKSSDLLFTLHKVSPLTINHRRRLSAQHFFSSDEKLNAAIGLVLFGTLKLSVCQSVPEP